MYLLVCQVFHVIMTLGSLNFYKATAIILEPKLSLLTAHGYGSWKVWISTLPSSGSQLMLPMVPIFFCPLALFTKEKGFS